MGGGRCARAAHCASRAFVNGAAGGAKKNLVKNHGGHQRAMCVSLERAFPVVMMCAFDVCEWV